MELEAFLGGIGTAGPGVAAAAGAKVGPCALPGFGAARLMGGIAGTGEGEACKDPAGSIMPLAWPELPTGSEDPDPPDGPGPGACSGVVPGGSAAPLQAPSVSTSRTLSDVSLTNVATIPRSVRGTSPQSFGLPGCKALDKSRTTS